MNYSKNQAALNGLVKLLQRHRSDGQRLDRIVIAGGPRAGKSTLASMLGAGYRIHDGEELTDLEWSAGSLKASEWLDEPGPWICENVAMARALRKWLTRNPTGPVPADLVIHIGFQVTDRLPGQQRMALGCRTVWEKIKPELMRRGTRILESSA